MLLITRHVNEKIHIGDNVTITIAHIRKDQVKIGIDAPLYVKVVRDELINGYPKKTEELAAPPQKG